MLFLLLFFAFSTDGTLAIPLFASLESAKIQTQKPGDVELARMRSLAYCAERKIEHDFPDFNEYVYCFITMMHQRVSNMVFTGFNKCACNFLSILLQDQTTQLCHAVSSQDPHHLALGCKLNPLGPSRFRVTCARGLFEPQPRVLFGKFSDQGHPPAYSAFDHRHQSRV